MNKKTLHDIDVKGKKVFCRVDFNVPLQDGEITDDTRIRAALPTINHLIKQEAIIILASHLGRPKGEVVEELRLDPVAKRLSDLTGKEITKVDSVYGEEVNEAISTFKNGDILLLENVRFDAGEEANDERLIDAFSQMADFYVNDAFGTAHRAHASTAGVAEKLPATAGFLMEKEIKVLSESLENPERPFTAIIGGAKVTDKIKVIENLLDKVDHLLLGGGLANTFIKALGHDIGNSIVEEENISVAKNFIEQAKEKGVNMMIPEDVVVADSFSKDADTKITAIGEIPMGWQALDIGPKSREAYSQIIVESNLVLWNGPMGVFEMNPFAGGTNEVARALVDTSAFTIIGGGDSAAAIEKFGFADEMDHISTGGGASLEFMEGKELPGIRVLDDK